MTEVKIVFRSESSNKLLHAMQENPYITTEELSKEADIVVTAVKKQLRAMIEKKVTSKEETTITAGTSSQLLRYDHLADTIYTTR